MAIWRGGIPVPDSLSHFRVALKDPDALQYYISSGIVSLQTAIVLSFLQRQPLLGYHMFLRLRNFFRSFRLHKPRSIQPNPVVDQTDLQNANEVPPIPPTSLERSPSTDAESSNQLRQDFWDLAMKLRPSFPPTCNWLDPKDLQDIEEPPVDGGRFAEVWKGHLENREVAIKSYRCYVCFDCDRVRMVSYSKRRCDLYGYN